MEEPATTDPDLFELVHRLLHGETPGKPVDRRDDPRRPYHCLQLMAFYSPPQTPNASVFQQVPCEDISAHGMSFYLPEPPEQKQVVVALGNVPFTFLIAEIVRAQPVRRDDGLAYQIGCRFTGRLS
jgi:hypothetical protein